MPTTPDIRVRLSPEGVEDVVAAFRKIQNESRTTGRVGSAAVNGLNGAVRELARLLPAISLAALTREVVQRTIEAERSFNRLNTALKTTGFSAGLTSKQIEQLVDQLKNSTTFDDDEIRNAISALLRFRDVQGEVFQQAAKLAPDLATALNTDIVSAARQLGRALTDPEKGMQGLREAGVRLSEQQIEVATKLKNTGDLAGAQQIVIEALTKSVGGAAAGENVGLYGSTKALSKAWDDLLKALGKRATEGDSESIVGKITRDVQTLARVINESKVLESLKAFATFGASVPAPTNPALEEIDKKLAIARSQLASGSLNPPGAPTGFFGFLIPDVKLGQQALEKLKTTIADLEAQRERIIGIRKDTAAAAASGEDPEAEQARLGREERDRERAAELAARNARIQQEKQIALGRVASDSALQQEQQLAQQRTKILDLFYSQSLISTRDYYAARRNIVDSQLAAEVKALNDKMVEEARALDLANDQGDTQKAIAALANLQKLIDERSRLQLRAANDQIALTLEEQRVNEQLTREKLQSDAQIAESEGRRRDAAIAGLEEEIRKRRELLKLLGKTPQEIDADTARVRQIGTRNIDLDETKRGSDLQLRDLALQREAINRQVATGKLFDFQGEERIIELERQRLPILRSIADEMLRLAGDDPFKIQEAKEFAAAIEDIEVHVDQAGREMAEFKARAVDAVQGDLSNFLTDGIDQAESFGEAIRNLAFTVSQSLRKIAADMLATEIIKRTLSLFGIGGEGPEKVATAAAAGTAQATPLIAASTALSTAGGVVITAAGAISASAASLLAAAQALATAGASSAVSGAGSFASLFGFAEGGLTKGVGGPTADKNLGLFSPGEFVTRAAVVKQPGALDFLRAFNREGMGILPIQRAIPSFADGGAVEPVRSSLDSSLTVGLDDGLVLKALESPEGQRVIIKIAGRNKRALRGVLGT